MPQIPKITLLLSNAQLAEFERLLMERRHTATQMTAWLAERGFKLNPATVRKHGRRIGATEARPKRFTLLDKVLKPEDREPFEKLLGDPRVSNREVADWLLQRGYRPVHGQTLMNHRNRFLDRLEAVSESARFAQAMVQFVRQQGTAVVSEGMLTKLEQLLLEQLSRLEKEQKLEPHHLVELSRSVTGAVTGRETMEQIRREREESMRKAAEVGEAAAKRGASGRDVVARMREILGV